jgi:hypothetical protein
MRPALSKKIMIFVKIRKKREVDLRVRKPLKEGITSDFEI